MFDAEGTVAVVPPSPVCPLDQGDRVLLCNNPTAKPLISRKPKAWYYSSI